MNEPLTLNELKKKYWNSYSIGYPILVKTKWGSKIHCVLDHSKTHGIYAAFSSNPNPYYTEKDYGKTWWAFDYPPAHIDREAWEGCEHCKNDSMNGEGNSHDFRVSEGAIYYYDSEFGWEGVDADYCPWCGRPLTEEAWKELEKRVRGEK